MLRDRKISPKRVVPFLSLLLACFAPVARAEVPSVKEILDRSLERAKWYDEEKIENRFTFDIFRASEKLDKQKLVVKREEFQYKTVPYEGFLFERLVKKDGRPLTESEVRKEDSREEEFRSKVDRGEDPTEEGNQRVSFDERLVSKYDFSLEGIVEVRGRPTYLLEFVPKSTDLPVETRMDRALNNSEGEIWIDCETFELARVHFEMKKKISLWWGLIGSISELEGTVEREEVAEGIWLPSRFQIYLNGRIFFASLHRNEFVEWKGFSLITGQPDVQIAGK